MSRARNVAMVAGAVAPILVALIGKLPPVSASTPAAPAATPTVVLVTEPTPVATPAAAPSPGATPTPGATPLPAATATPSPAPVPASVPAPAKPLPRLVTDMNAAACLKHFEGMDLPLPRGDEAALQQTLVCRRGYVLSYNVTTHNPDWVVERLSPAVLRGTAKRRDNFGLDELLRGIDPALTDLPDYAKSGYDRGHQAPAGDAKFDQSVMDETFRLSNMAPQIGIGFNRGVWKYLEENVRAWVLCGGHPDLFVITGPIYAPGGKTIGVHKVAVPHAFFKIVYDPASGRTVGFVLENVKIGSRINNLQDYVRPIADIETETGLNFFSSWSIRRQTLIEASPGVAWAHTGTCSGNAED